MDRLRVLVGGERWDVGRGELIVLADNLREPVTALEETAFLPTVAWTPGAVLRAGGEGWSPVGINGVGGSEPDSARSVRYCPVL